MSKLSMRLIAAWIALHATAELLHVDDSRATVALGVLGLAAAFFAFVDSTSYRSVSKKG